MLHLTIMTFIITMALNHLNVKTPMHDGRVLILAQQKPIHASKDPRRLSTRIDGFQRFIVRFPGTGGRGGIRTLGKT